MTRGVQKWNDSLSEGKLPVAARVKKRSSDLREKVARCVLQTILMENLWFCVWMLSDSFSLLFHEVSDFLGSQVLKVLQG